MTIEDRRIPMGIGAEDSRPQMSAVEGRVIDRPDSKLLPVPKLTLDQVVAENLNDRDILEEETSQLINRSVSVLDSTEGLEFEFKRDIFVYGVWDHDPDLLAYAGRLVGLSKAQAFSALERALGSNRFRYELIKFHYLMKPDALEIRNLRRNNTKVSEIAQQRGLSIAETSEIVKDLILLEEVDPDPRGADRAERFKEICDLVEFCHQEGLTVPETAIKLSIPQWLVRHARERLTRVGRIEKRSRQEVANKRFPSVNANRKAVERLRIETDMTVNQISLIAGISSNQTRRRIKELIQTSRIPRKGKGNPRKKKKKVIFDISEIEEE